MAEQGTAERPGRACRLPALASTDSPSDRRTVRSRQSMNMMRIPFRLENEIALITGGGTGLGLGIARCFVEAGARVVLVGRREPELSHAAAALGKNAFAVPHDVTEVDRAHELMERA